MGCGVAIVVIAATVVERSKAWVLIIFMTGCIRGGTGEGWAAWFTVARCGCGYVFLFFFFFKTPGRLFRYPFFPPGSANTRCPFGGLALGNTTQADSGDLILQCLFHCTTVKGQIQELSLFSSALGGHLKREQNSENNDRNMSSSIRVGAYEGVYC